MNKDYIFSNKELLTADEERALFEHIDDPSARERLILANQRLIVWAVKKYLGMMDYDDLMQEGNIGLMKAIAGFDYKKGYKFATYATTVIQRHVYRKIANSGIIRTGVGKDEIPVLSLDESVGAGDEPLVNLVEAPEQDRGDRQKQAVDYVMSILSTEEREVLAYYYLREGSMPNLAAKYGVSHQSLCLMRDKTIRKLRHPDIIDTLRNIVNGREITA